MKYSSYKSIKELIDYKIPQYFVVDFYRLIFYFGSYERTYSEIKSAPQSKTTFSEKSSIF